jgi:hypothetical protein
MPTAPPEHSDPIPLTEAAELVGRTRRTLERRVAAGDLVSRRVVVDGRPVRCVSRAQLLDLYDTAPTQPGEGATRQDTRQAAAVAVQGWRESKEALAGAQEQLVLLRQDHRGSILSIAGELQTSRRWGIGAWAVAALVAVIGGWGAWRGQTLAMAAEASLSTHQLAAKAQVEVIQAERAQERAELAQERAELAGQILAAESRLKDQQALAREFGQALALTWRRLTAR